MRRRLSVFLSIVALLTLYTGLRVRGLLPGEPGLAWALTLAFVGFVVGWQFAYRRRMRTADEGLDRLLAWAASFGLGVWATFLFFSLVFDLLFLRLPWLSAGVLAASGLLAGAGLWEALAGPKVKEVAIRVPGLSPGLRGLRIVHLTDLHIGPTIRQEYVEQVVAQVEALKPDLIAVTGDIADGTVEGLRGPVEPLSRLKAPLGVFFVTGNHEYYWGAEAWLDACRKLGWTALVNENRIVARDGSKLLVGGVTDASGGSFIPSHASDPRKAAESGERADFRLLLSHRPGSGEEAERAGFDLQLSGHTHGGQFFPWSLVIPLFHRYYRGLYRHGRMWLYVNVGTGYWGPPHRLAVRSEIACLTLEDDSQEPNPRSGARG